MYLFQQNFLYEHPPSHRGLTYTKSSSMSKGLDDLEVPLLNGVTPKRWGFLAGHLPGNSPSLRKGGIVSIFFWGVPSGKLT